MYIYIFPNVIYIYICIYIYIPKCNSLMGNVNSLQDLNLRQCVHFLRPIPITSGTIYIYIYIYIYISTLI